MARARSRLVSLVAWCLSIAIAVACFQNVFGEDREVQQRAKEAACGARPGCSAQMTQISRTPIEHTYVFATPTGSIEVRCRRAFILLGEYACTGPASEVTRPPAMSASVPASAFAPASASASAPARSGKPRR